LWLLDLDTLEVIAEVDRPILIAARRFQRDVVGAVPGFLRGEQEARGTLRLSCPIPGAVLTLNGEVIRSLPHSVKLKPGKYELTAERDQFLPVRRLITIEANQETKEVVQMILRPGGRLDESKAVAAAPSVPPPGALRWPTFVAGGLTIASAGTAIGLAISTLTQERALQAGYDEETHVYAGTRRQALEARKLAVATNIAWGVSGGLAALTVVLGIIDAIPREAAASVAVNVDAHGAHVAVGGRF
jgi:hypothetical protein